MSPERLAQRFYVAFCLFMSSVQDSILGQKERASNNLNWSATCSYYSLVHASRLLCFLAFGDFPTSHAQLRHVLSSHPQPRTNPRGRRHGYPFDWLSGFSTPGDGRAAQVHSSEGGTTGEFRQIIAAYLSHIQVTDVERRLNRLGALVSAAGHLRNDSNYEALLIAHEYRHVAMSDTFENLSHSMGVAAESNQSFMIDAFNGFRRHDPDLQERRDKYEAFLHEYVHRRIGRAIRRKLGDSRTLERKLEDVLRRIGTRSTGARFDDLEDEVSMALFGSKARLMMGFMERIMALERETRA